MTFTDRTYRLFRMLAVLLAPVCITSHLAAAEGDKADAGLELARKYCATCHAVANEPDSPHKDAPPFRTFASKWPLENLEEALAEGIVTGHPDMPAFVFEPQEIDSLLEHLHRLAPHAREKQ